MNWILNEAKEKIVLLGSQYEVKGEVNYFCNKNYAATLSIGLKTKDHNLGRPNEDSVGYIDDDEILVAVIADSHFGGIMSDAIIYSFIEEYGDYRDEIRKLIDQPTNIIYNKFIDLILSRLNHLNDHILPRIKKHHRVGESTFIVVLRIKDELYHFSYGDSMLYLYQNNDIELLNKINYNFLVEGLPNIKNYESLNQFVGYNKLEKDYQIILMTDGYPGIYGAPPPEGDELKKIMGLDPKSSLENIVKYSFNNGGEDNLGIIIIS